MEIIRRSSYKNKLVPWLDYKICNYNDIIDQENKYMHKKEWYIKKVLHRKLTHITFSVDSHPKSMIMRSMALSIFFEFMKIVVEELFNHNIIRLQDLGDIQLRSKPFDTKYKGKKKDYLRAKNKGFYTMICITYKKQEPLRFKYGYPYWSFGETYKNELLKQEDKGVKF